MDELTGIIAILSAVALPLILVGYILIYWLRTRHRERTELLKQGIVPAAQMKAMPNKYSMLRNGCLLIGLALGLIVGMVIESSIDYSDLGSFLIVLSSSILFIGAGYVVFYLLVKNKITDEY